MNWFSKIKNEILNIFFPIHCLGCGRAALSRRSLGGGGGWVCGDCLGFVNFEGVFLCPRCGNSCYLGRVCKRCAGKSYLDGVVAMGKYSDKFLQKLIKFLKFQYLTDLESVFDKLVKRFCLKYSAVFPPSSASISFRRDYGVTSPIVVPVPLHPIRFRERGFNQAEYIAKFVSGALGYEISDVLQRTRYTYRQSELPKEMREKNIKGAFSCKGNVGGKIVVLVDDVYTSGGTMQECAKVLKEAGAKEVWGFVLAR